MGDTIGKETSGRDLKEIVKEWAAEFKLDGLWSGDDDSNDTQHSMQMES